MVKVPTPSYQGASELGGVKPVGIREAQPHNFAAGVAEAWRPWAQLAGGMTELGAQLQKQENEKNLLEIQNATAEWERDKMFGEGGWASQDGEDAFGLTKRAGNEWQEFQGQLLDGRNMNGATRRAAEQYLSGRRNSSLEKLAGAEFKHREAYAVNQLAAGIELEVETAASYWSNPTDVAVHTSLALQKLDQVHERQGIALDSPQAQKAEKALLTNITKGVFTNMRAEDPVKALAYLNGAEAAGNIDGVSASAMRLQVTDEAKRSYGGSIGRSAYQGVNQPGTVGAMPQGNVVDFMIGTPDAPGALVTQEGAYKVAAAKGVAPGTVMSPTNDLGVAQLNIAIRNPADASKRGHFGYGVTIDVDRYENDTTGEYQHQVARDMYTALYTHPKSPTRGNWVLSALAYNAGAGRVQNWIKDGMPLEGEGALDPITEDYIKGITNGAVDLNKLGAERAVAMGEAGATSDGLPQDLNAAVPEAVAKQGGAAAEYEMFNRLLAIPDDKVREAAIQEFLQLGQQKARIEGKIKDDLQDGAYAWLDEGNGSLDDYLAANPGSRDILGSALPALRAYEKRDAYVDPTEGTILFQNLMTSPDAFADMTLADFDTTFRHQFGKEEYLQKRADFIELKLAKANVEATDAAETAKLKAEAAQGRGQLALSATTAGTAVTDAAGRLGLEPLNKKDKAQVMAYSQAEARIRAEHQRYVEKHGVAMSPLQLMGLAEREMLKGIEINSADWRGRLEGQGASDLSTEDLIARMERAAETGGIIDTADFGSIEIPIRSQTGSGGYVMSKGKVATAEISVEELRIFTEDYRSRYPGASMREVTYALLAQYGWGANEPAQRSQ